jgi:RNA-directed DNA polymerase
MLSTLERGVKGGIWFSLIDKVWSLANLHSAFCRVKKNKGKAGVDNISIKDFEKNLEQNLINIHEQLRKDVYKPQAIRRVYIPKPGSSEKRPLGIPTIRDRVVQTALRNVIEPIFDNDFTKHNYGFRPKHGAKQALARVDELLEDDKSYVVDADIKGFFDTIPHDIIMARVEEKISDGRILSLIRAFLHQGIMDGLKVISPIEGTPQGAVISPLLANAVLSPLDKLMSKKGLEMTRYADDFIIMCGSLEQAENALSIVNEWMNDNGLTLHPVKTKIVESKCEQFEFLGYCYSSGRKWVRKKSLKKMRDSIKMKTKRTQGKSINCIIGRLNRSLKGWYEYFKEVDKYEFIKMDGFVRRRLRSILRRYEKKSGGTGRCYNDHKKWPNKFFANNGLFSLMDAHLKSLSP